ncbi:MAG TPA: RagB/SusD family nutrient uptake outer membrane protein [Porphyromonadaceae bacterium]|uniref:RagB/SusD family nutrient uptake outer membrane protein n=1 Tax=Proteiniphilum sp. UBA5510 TaxID=1947286 RepID=UPI000E984483|nr:RagB/SusD family nutrient uptake outer membrane protein [Proteiniphilum sp. UBA5510]HBT84739.1 RagB/SusD family nutrient uptake outer membrane protein [Porphyromonadaceae bacterium]
MKKIIYKLFIFSGLFFISCMDLDIPPRNILTNEIVFTTKSGVDAYIAKLYRDLPIEDFLCSTGKGWNNTDGNSGFGTWAGLTGEAIGHSVRSMTHLDWWTEGYKMLRDINIFLETLPQYSSNFSVPEVNQWIGEVYFMRAFAYYTMAIRYGGVIIVNESLKYPNETGDISEYMLSRSSEEDTWDQILSDYNEAIKLLDENKVTGRVNKYVAAAYKARAMLFAASIANFNTTSHFDTENQIRLCGIPKARAVDYYREAYEASKMCEGQYSLYKGDWIKSDPSAVYTNYLNILQFPNNNESILIREFKYPTYVHSFDCINSPFQYRVSSVVSTTCPTAEYVALFDGLDLDANGDLNFLDENGNYIMYDNLFDPYKNIEPRGRATIIFPGDIFWGEPLEIWRGIYTGPTEGGISKFFPKTSLSKYNTVKNVTSAANQTGIKSYTLETGEVTTTSGRSGSFNSEGYGSKTGFQLRKNMNSNLVKNMNVAGMSEQDWVDMRYAEVMLIRAEAAFELVELGNSNSEYLNDSYLMINEIRERAGATLMASMNELTRDVIRKERKKELGFENKAYWDLIRWRTYDIEQSSNRRYSSVFPFRISKNGKWIFDLKNTENTGYNFTFKPVWYYMSIPNSEISKNNNLLQNPI